MVSMFKETLSNTLLPIRRYAIACTNDTTISMVSCQKGPTRIAYAWQIGPFGQDTIDMSIASP